MADEAENTNHEQTAAPRKPATLVIMASLVGGIAVGALGGIFALGPVLAKRLATPTAEAATPVDHDADQKGGTAKGEKPGAVVHMMENLVLNPSGSNGTRFLIVAVAAEVNGDKVKEEMTARDAEMRDAVLRLLGERTVEQLTDMSLRDGIKRQLSDSLNARLGRKDAVTRVYFPQFVIQ